MNLFTKLGCFFISILLVFSCKLEKKPSEAPISKSGREIYGERCTSCHGMDGKLGFGGAKDLTLSSKTIDEINHQVTNGKGAMAPFKNILTIAEIDSVSTYAFSMRK